MHDKVPEDLHVDRETVEREEVDKTDGLADCGCPWWHLEDEGRHQDGCRKAELSRTPRPAHPAELAADRLVDMLQRYNPLQSSLPRFTVEEIETLHAARKALWRIATEDDK